MLESISHLYAKHEITLLRFTMLTRCFSEVGMSGLRQMVSLNFEVCATYGTIVHELLHVLGLWHEQSRADRDRYVRVVWNNVVPSKLAQ